VTLSRTGSDDAKATETAWPVTCAAVRACNPVVFNGSWLIDLPFGKGKRYGSSAGSIADALIGGWEISGFLHIRSGLPQSPGDDYWATNWFVRSVGTFLTPVHTSVSRHGPNGQPNIFSDANAAYQQLAFTMPGESGSRNSLESPAYSAVDMAVHKSFRMPWNETHRIQARVSAYNLFNTVNFSTTSIASPQVHRALSGKSRTLLVLVAAHAKWNSRSVMSSSFVSCSF